MLSIEVIYVLFTPCCLFHGESDVAHGTRGLHAAWDGGHQQALEYYPEEGEQDPYYFSNNEPIIEFPDEDSNYCGQLSGEYAEWE